MVQRLYEKAAQSGLDQADVAAVTLLYPKITTAHG
jgi:hypothetical protein